MSVADLKWLIELVAAPDYYSSDERTLANIIAGASGIAGLALGGLARRGWAVMIALIFGGLALWIYWAYQGEANAFWVQTIPRGVLLASLAYCIAAATGAALNRESGGNGDNGKPESG